MSVNNYPGGEIPSPAGQANKVLTTNGSSVLWGAGSGMTLLGSVNASGSFVSISNIDQSYRDLRIVGVNLRVASSDVIQVRVNNVTGSSYYSVTYLGTVSSTSVTNTTGINGAPFAQIFTNGANGLVLDIINYSDTALNAKPWRSVSGNSNSASQFTGFGVFNSSANTQYGGIGNITSVGFYSNNNFNAGTFYLYGVK